MSLAPGKLWGVLSGTGGKLVSKAWLSKPSELAPAGTGRGASPSLEVVRLPTDGGRCVGEGGMPEVALACRPARDGIYLVVCVISHPQQCQFFCTRAHCEARSDEFVI